MRTYLKYIIAYCWLALFLAIYLAADSPVYLYIGAMPGAILCIYYFWKRIQPFVNLSDS